MTDKNILVEDFSMLQEFIDNTFVNNSIAMPSRIIYSKVKNKLKSTGIEESQFVQAFSMAVREGSLKGIKGFKRVGFKRVGSEEAVEFKQNPLTKDFEMLQKFIDMTFVNDSVAMPAKVIWKKVKLTEPLDEKTFVSAFSQAVRDGHLTGIVGVRRLGYKRGVQVSEGTSIDEDIKVDTEETNTAIYINNNWRIISEDKNNWSIQKRLNSGTWISNMFYPSFDQAARRAAELLLTGKVRSAKINATEFQDMANLFKESESRILNEIRLVRG
ncbi:MAG: hypothetical protein HC877_23405 [Thioploca sp.]|nr:hypothetical protein [Thioploca sp.]